MKRILWTLTLVVLLPAFLQARSVLEFTLDAGYSSTSYKLSEGKLTGGLGYGANLGYAWFFHQNVGLGLGFGFRHYAGGVKIDGTLDYKDVVDTDNEPYEHFTYYNNWREKQDMYYLEFPVSLQVFVPLQGVHLWMAVGANYSLSMSGKTAAQGDLTHRGYYKKWDLTLDIPAHGFYETSDFKPSQNIKPESTVALFARLDVGIPLTRHLDLIIGANVHYAVMSVYKLERTTPLGFRNDKKEWSEAHKFMENYSSLLNTPIVSGKALPWSVDFEIGLKYSFSHKHQKKYTCRCMSD